ncbi:MAG: hypothetical protein LBS75_07595 [Synergistaceae bacterium]|nr:hypothetical protein [Synergistaceae bacterium]
MGYTWARFLIDEPLGESLLIYGEDGQLEGTHGYSFTMPMDSAAGDLRGVSGVYGTGIALTPGNIGRERYKVDPFVKTKNQLFLSSIIF